MLSYVLTVCCVLLALFGLYMFVIRFFYYSQSKRKVRMGNCGRLDLIVVAVTDDNESAYDDIRNHILALLDNVLQNQEPDILIDDNNEGGNFNRNVC